MPSLTKKIKLRAPPISPPFRLADGADPVDAGNAAGKAATAAPETALLRNARLDVSDMPDTLEYTLR